MYHKLSGITSDRTPLDFCSSDTFCESYFFEPLRPPFEENYVREKSIYSNFYCKVQTYIVKILNTAIK